MAALSCEVVCGDEDAEDVRKTRCETLQGMKVKLVGD